MAIHEDARRGFGRGAAAYERGRPDYPREAIDWLSAQLDLRAGRTVLDVAAGTGKLTRELVPTGATVVAVEPMRAMRAVLEQLVPGVEVLDATAEALPVADGSVDAVVVASAFHWFDAAAAAAEFHRVLRPAGRLGLLWNRRRLDQPLQRAVDDVIGRYRDRSSRPPRDAWRRPLDSSGLFRPAAEREVPFEQVLDAGRFVDRFTSISFVSALPDPERAAVVVQLRELAASVGEPLRLGYTGELYVYERV